jgi:hypothetical protein
LSCGLSLDDLDDSPDPDLSDPGVDEPDFDEEDEELDPGFEDPCLELDGFDEDDDKPDPDFDSGGRDLISVTDPGVDDFSFPGLDDRPEEEDGSLLDELFPSDDFPCPCPCLCL